MVFKPSDIYTGKASKDALLITRNNRSFYTYIQRRKGYVYAITHPDRVGIIKIGRTSKNPFLRAKTLGTAGILGKFDVAWCASFADSVWAETTLHKQLAHLNVGKEFFNIHIDEAKLAINGVHTIEGTILRFLEKELLLTATYTAWVDALEVSSLIEY